MKDSNYIKPIERQVVTDNDAGDYSTLEYQLVDSHAVVDDIARELAEDLRAGYDVEMGVEFESLARYDRVMGK